jgi:hypothetical protein
MDKSYWISRKRASLKAAQNAVGAEARLAHYDLAGRYSVKAASVETAAVNLADSLPPPLYAAQYPALLRGPHDD